MKSAYFVLSSLVALAAAYSEDNEPHFINWDALEHPIVESFRWARPFPDDGTPPMGFVVRCEVKASLQAKQYKFREISSELAPWAGALRDFYTERPYAGHWDGVNEGGDNRDLIMMEWKDVPKLVREWIEEQHRLGRDKDNRWSFAIFQKPKKKDDIVTETLRAIPTAAPGEDPASVREAAKVKDKDKVVFFVAGAIYEILPLWVAKGSKCEKDFADLSRYQPIAKDNSVIAWVTRHTKPDKHHAIEWRIRALDLAETEDGRHHRNLWERLHTNLKRQERRQVRDQRVAEADRLKDEL